MHQFLSLRFTFDAIASVFSRPPRNCTCLASIGRASNFRRSFPTLDKMDVDASRRPHAHLRGSSQICTDRLRITEGNSRWPTFLCSGIFSNSRQTSLRYIEKKEDRKKGSTISRDTRYVDSTSNSKYSPAGPISGLNSVDFAKSVCEAGFSSW